MKSMNHNNKNSDQKPEIPMTYQDEWRNSYVSDDIISLNVRYLQGRSPWEYLMYGLPPTERTNTGVLRSGWLQKYKHLDYGGWWCNGMDIMSFTPESLENKTYGVETEWGCFKPDKPRLGDKQKPIKYEHPPQTPTEVFALKISEENWQNIGERLRIEIPKEPGKLGYRTPEVDFWQWVLDNPKIPLVITEGAKKAGCLLTLGYVTVALPGINSGYRNEDGIKRLIPQLEVLTENREEVIICFDQDRKFETRKNVRDAVKAYKKILKSKGCRISVIYWDSKLGKGVDDFVAANGDTAFHYLYKDRSSFDDWLTETTQEAKTLKYFELHNYIETEMAEDLSLDVLRSQILYNGKKLEIDDFPKAWFYETTGYIASPKDLEEAIKCFANKNSFHPVQQYLAKVFRDSERTSIDNLATRYLGTDNPMYDLMVKRWLISAVARAMKPGEQVDHTLVLQGPQGMYKSRFFKSLGGEFYDASVDGKLNDKDTKLKIHSCWIQEIAEYDRMNKREQGEIKSWLTVREDNFRKPYAKETKLHPRSCVFGATVNENEFLMDQTGDRRLWVIPVNIDKLPGGKIDYQSLEDERDKIWASAVDAYKSGERWWTDREEEKAISELNERFRDFDEWQPIIIEYLETNNLDWVTTAQILEKVFFLAPTDQDRQLQMRVARIMNRLGWERKRIGEHRIRGWAKPQPFIVKTEKEVGLAETLTTKEPDQPKKNRPTPPEKVGLAETPTTREPDQPDQPDQPLLEKFKNEKIIEVKIGDWLEFFDWDNIWKPVQLVEIFTLETGEKRFRLASENIPDLFTSDLSQMRIKNSNGNSNGHSNGHSNGNGKTG